jgi:predicted flap endonuclease-1-like 5' DNA nuclease
VIWHFFEVWLLMLLAFAVGGVLGALLYDLAARSSLATAQGRMADTIGDVVDGLKARLGVGPVWRPEYRRVAGRAMVAADGELNPVAFQPAELPAPRNAPALPPPIAAPDAGVAEEGGAAGEGYDPDELPDAALSGESDAEETREAIVPMRPAGLSSPRNGVPDNLQRIRGVGERNEALLNSLGIFHFGQIAAWTPGEVRWVGAYLAFPERIERDDWVGQATILATGGDTGFVKAAERRRARRQQQLEDVEPEFDAIEDEVAPDDTKPDQG